MPWPFTRKAIRSLQLKSASFLMSPGGYSSALTGAGYRTYAIEGYQQNPIVHACITKVAAAAASIEWQLYQKDAKGKLKKLDTHPLLDLIQNPNKAQSGKEFIRSMVSYYLTSGNNFVFGNGIDPNSKAAKPPTELQLLNPGKVQVKAGKGLFPLAFEYRPNGEQLITYPVDQVSGKSAVLHFKTFNPLDPWTGMPPMAAAAFSVDIHNEGAKWNKRLIDNGARPSGALVVKNADGSVSTLSDEQYRRLQEQIDAQFSGSANAGRPMLLEGGLDWKEMSINPKDMDFLKGKDSAARDIGLVFGVPSQLLQIPGDSTFANYEQATLSFWSDTVLPLMGMFLDGFNRWLTPLYGPNLFLWYDEDSIPALEPRRKEKFDRVQNAAWMTLDEKRVATGEGELPNGIGKILVLDGRGAMLNAQTGEIISLSPATPTNELGQNAPQPDAAAKHRKWLEANGYTPERAERLAKLMYS